MRGTCETNSFLVCWIPKYYDNHVSANLVSWHYLIICVDKFPTSGSCKVRLFPL